jgi:hypothetical protein
MQPYAFSPWIWRDPDAMSGYLPPDSGTGDEVATDSVAGYRVEATDGHIGSVDEASYEVGGSYIVVDTGPWIFGRKVLLPAGTVQRIDRDERKVYVDRTKEQVKNSPEYDKDTFDSADYREQVGTYYSDSYRTAPPPR